MTKSRYILVNTGNQAKTDHVVFMLDGADSSMKRKLSFYYHDAVAHGHPVYITKSNSSVELAAPALFFRPNAEQTPFLIYPGESIHIKSIENDAIEMYIKGNQQRTNELNFFAKLVKQTGNIFYAFTSMPYHKKVGTISEMKGLETKINHVKNARLKFLNSYSRVASVSNSFEKLAMATIRSTALADTLFLYFNNRDLLNKQNMYQKLVSDKIASIKNIDMVPLQTFYTACTMLVSLNSGKPPLYSIQNKAELIQRFNMIERRFDGGIRNFLMANALCTAHNNGIPASGNFISKFNTLCTDTAYRSIVHQAFNEKEFVNTPPGSSTLLLADGKSVLTMQSLLTKHRGKLLLLDFWASWCGPCREEIPYMQSLEKEYKNESIVFVSISTDQKTTEWLKAMKQEAFTNGQNYQLLKADQSSFVKQYKIYTIPRYLLIDKQGNVVSDDAPRPSNPKLKVLIAKYL